MRNEAGLYRLLEKKLRAAKRPLTATELFDDNEVKKLAETVNRVSDYLGGLWRRGVVQRMPAPRMPNNLSRWTYEWIGYESERGAKPGKPVVARPNIEVVERAGTIFIELPDFTITVKRRS